MGISNVTCRIYSTVPRASLCEMGSHINQTDGRTDRDKDGAELWNQGGEQKNWLTVRRDKQNPSNFYNTFPYQLNISECM